MSGRTFTLTVAGERPLTVNKVIGMHRMRWATHTATTREVWWAAALAQKVPPLARCRIVATPLHRDHRSPQDVAACAPEVKAAVDGLVDAGVLTDDDATHLVAIEFQPPLIDGVDGLRLTIEEVA